MMPKCNEDKTEIENYSSISVMNVKTNVLNKILAEFGNTLKEYPMIKWNLFWDVALGDLLTFFILVKLI